MSNKLVMLAFGDTNGHFKVLYKKLKSVCKKVSDISFAVCVGNFFTPDCDEEWQQVLTSQIIAPIQIFILGPTSRDVERFYGSGKDMRDLAEKVTYLGKSGTYCTAEGLRLAFVSGTFSESNNMSINYTYQDVNKLLQDTMNNGRADVLLSWASPQYTPTSEYSDTSKVKEVALSYLFCQIAPQYHLAGGEREAYEIIVDRHFYNGLPAGTSRFYGLSFLGNDSGGKWMKALNITPFSANSRYNTKEVIYIVPYEMCNMTEFINKYQMRIDAPPSQYFFARPRKHRLEDGGSRNTKAHKTEDLPCWFCFSSAEFEKHLILSIGESSFLALAKGPIVDEHVLISPIEHRLSMRVLEEESIMEVEKYKAALRDTYATFECKPVFYERTYKTSHLQIHALPIPERKFDSVATMYKVLSKKYNLPIEEFLSNHRSYMSLDEDISYFHVDLGNGHELLIKGEVDHFPLNFGREALISEDLLNLPHKQIWHDCRLTQEQEIELVESFKRSFKRFDFTAEKQH